MRQSNYDKTPFTAVEGKLWKGWEDICGEIRRVCPTRPCGQTYVIRIECYQGVHHDELREAFSSLSPSLWIDTERLFKSPGTIQEMTFPYVTDDRLFGFRSHFKYADFLDQEKTREAQALIAATEGCVVVYGHGAALVAPEAGLTVYADMPRWEIQQRARRHEIHNLGVDNRAEEPSRHYKRGYFVDWLVCDDLKKKLLPTADYWLDTTIPGRPKMIKGNTLRLGLEQTARRPFRVVPFFDPAPWGGQWMKEVCGLDPKQANYGWCFDCVPEENSLFLQVESELFEIPANDLVFHQTHALLGGPVESRFGQDFPIRFDFLDTMGGGNLSLQVHPTTQYIRDTFGIYYTQDESYYLLDAEEGATVYLGLKTGTDPTEMIAALNRAQETGEPFEAEKYVNRWPASTTISSSPTARYTAPEPEPWCWKSVPRPASSHSSCGIGDAWDWMAAPAPSTSGTALMSSNGNARQTLSAGIWPTTWNLWPKAKVGARNAQACMRTNSSRHAAIGLPAPCVTTRAAA